jgi:protein ImuB
MKRFVSIWFRYLLADRYVRRHPELKGTPFVLAAPQRGRMVVIASSPGAEALGILPGMVVADARAAYPALNVIEDPGLEPEKILKGLGEWAIRFTPMVAVDLPDGLILDATGCAHLWKGERPYLKDMVSRTKELGYEVRVAMAGTPGVAWALARFSSAGALVPPGHDKEAILPLPPAALRLPPETQDKLLKLGLDRLGKFIDMPPSVLRRRFGQGLPDRIVQVLGLASELLQPIQPESPYQERLPCLEPLRTATAIKMAIEVLLEKLCRRLAEENKGLQKAILKTYRLDGEMQEITIGTHRPTCHIQHLFRLFELKVPTIRPDLGIELFVLEAPVVVDMPPVQENLWSLTGANDHAAIAELLDRLAGRGGADSIHRYLPVARYWPERSIQEARSLEEKATVEWRTDRPRPTHLLGEPVPIQVAAPVPDYPPILFRYQNVVHPIRKADGPERIEQEWWVAAGEHRDYYAVEDEEGRRYWIFRSGHYEGNQSKWFLHGFFA